MKVLGNKELRRIFQPKRDETIGRWRILHNEELHNLFSSPNIISMIESRTVIWDRHVARMVRRGIDKGFAGIARSKETTRKT
jgi:hypothetical protein